MTPSQPIPADLQLADESRREFVLAHLAEFDAPTDAWTLVKRNASRSVYCREIDGVRWYLKHFHGKSLSHKLRRALGRSEALKEFRFSAELRENRISCQFILAARFDPKRRIEWALSQEVPNAEELSDWHAKNANATGEARNSLRKTARALAKLVGKMHAAGIVHNDLHCGNVLRQSDGTLVLMDLHRMGHTGLLGRRQMASNLAHLLHDREHLSTRTQRLRVLRDYLEFNSAAGSLRGWQWLVSQILQRHQAAFYRKRDRRVRGENKYFRSLKLQQGWRARVVLDSKRQLAGSVAAHNNYTAEQWRELLADPGSLFEGPDVQVVKHSPSTTVVRRTIQLGEHALDVYIKRSKIKTRLKRFLSILRRSKSFLAFLVGHEMINRHIPTALPLCSIDQRRGGVLMDSISITETVHADLLDAFMDRWLCVKPCGHDSLNATQQHTLAKQVLRELGRMLRKLHSCRYAHRDLKATNLMVRWEPGMQPEIVLIDLDGLRRVTMLTARRQLQGLMRLNVSLLLCPAVNRPGQLRMLLGYLSRPGIGRINFKPYWRMLDEWSQRKRHQQIRTRQKKQKAIRKPS
ncbi:MAG: hypothetical protein HN909_05915 [Phycisphaerales bacterium]|jgi:tRNA A-37 threonylcarbamoyl transferase component Bud32|nr:hypothetical protein [Phycisphaerales bacterium]MBT7171290.1 hypothetical protein [Phycisphaerales bacterium]